MPDLDELLADLEDEDTKAAIKAAFDAKDQSVAKDRALLDRDAKVQRERAKLAEKFPRAMVAFDKGRLNLPDDPSDEALVAALKDKEAELEELGVPVPGAKKEEPKTKTPPPDEEEDPAAAWGRDVAPGGSEADALSLLEEAKALMESDEYDARPNLIGVIHEMQMKGQGDTTQEGSLHAQLIEALQPKYKVGLGPGARITNLESIAGAGKKNVAKKKSAPKKSK